MPKIYALEKYPERGLLWGYTSQFMSIGILLRLYWIVIFSETVKINGWNPEKRIFSPLKSYLLKTEWQKYSVRATIRCFNHENSSKFFSLIFRYELFHISYTITVNKKEFKNYFFLREIFLLEALLPFCWYFVYPYYITKAHDRSAGQTLSHTPYSPEATWPIGSSVLVCRLGHYSSCLVLFACVDYVVPSQGILLCPQGLGPQGRRCKLRRAFTDATSDSITYTKTVGLLIQMHKLTPPCLTQPLPPGNVLCLPDLQPQIPSTFREKRETSNSPSPSSGALVAILSASPFCFSHT